jgi:hypothetical protein
LSKYYLKFSPYRKGREKFSITNTYLAVLLKEIIAVYLENHKKLINTLCDHNADLLIIKASSPDDGGSTDLGNVGKLTPV